MHCGEYMKKLLIVVDYQNDFVCGTLGFEKAVKLEKPIAEKIQSYRKNREQIVFTLDTHMPHYPSCKKALPVLHCIDNTNGWKLYGQVAGLIEDTDKCFIKSSYASADLFEYVKTQDYKSVELVGVVSNICLISNAVLMQAALPNTEIIIDANCTASDNAKLNEAALDIMEGLQMKVINRI